MFIMEYNSFLSETELKMLGVAAATLVSIICISEFAKARSKKEPKQLHNRVRKIAFLIASKDGQLTIAETVRAAKRNGRNVFVVSDGSADRTAVEAKKAGARGLALKQ